MADALVRLGGSLRLCVGVLDLFEKADLLAGSPCLLLVSFHHHLESVHPCHLL